MTSSSLSNGVIVTTGPKISSRFVRHEDRQIGDDCRREKITSTATLVDRFRRVPAERDLPAFFLREIDIELHLIELRLRDDRALVGCRFQRIADVALRRLLDEAIDEIFVGRALDEHARTAQANLALVGERRAQAAGDGGVLVGVGKDDVRILPAQLERNFLEHRRASLGHLAAGHRAAGERDRADLRMRCDRSADIWSGAVHDIEDAVRQTGFAANLAEQISRHRRQLARFGDGGVADGDRRRDFPAQQIERQVPRRDESRDAARLAQRVIERDAVGDVRFGFGVQDRGCEEAEIARGARNIEAARERERFARVDRFGARQFFQIALDQVGDAEKNSRSLRRGCVRPIRERFLGRGDRQLDVAAVAVGDLRIRLAGRRLDVVEILSADWRYELTVDEVLDLR